MGFYIPLNTQWVILATSLSRKSTTLVVTAENKEIKITHAPETQKKQTQNLPQHQHKTTKSIKLQKPGSDAFYDIRIENRADLIMTVPEPAGARGNWKMTN